MKALIQLQRNGDFPNLNFFNANTGFKELGWEINYFKCTTNADSYGIYQDFTYANRQEEVKLDVETVVVGGIPVIKAAFNKLGVAIPDVCSYPKQLIKYLKRNVISTTIGEFMNQFTRDGISVFIKPMDANRKLFTGYVASEYKDLIRIASVPTDVQIFKSEIVDFHSEYRVFVHNNKVVGMKHYKGDFNIFPATGIIDMMVNDFEDAPVAYVLDVGVMLESYNTRNGIKNRYATALVEVNDATAFGCYGLHPVIHAKMLAARWEEVVKTKKSK